MWMARMIGCSRPFGRDHGARESCRGSAIPLAARQLQATRAAVSRSDTGEQCVMRKDPVRSGTGSDRRIRRRFQASARGIQAVFLMVILIVAPLAAVSARDADQKRI